MSAPQVEFYAGTTSREAVLWNSANILDHNLSNSPETGEFMQVATWRDDEGRLCRLSSEAAENSHFIDNKNVDKKYGRICYKLSRTESEGGTTFTYVIDSDRKRIGQLDADDKPLAIGKRFVEAALLSSILSSYNDYPYPEILVPYNTKLNGLNEVEAFNEIALHFDEDKQAGRMRRIGRKFRGFIGE